jgi:hypothetical protein
LVKFYFEPLLARGNFLAARRHRYRRICPRYVYWQEYVPNGGDWRITTLGSDLISAFVRRNRPGDFRASGSGRFQPLEECDLPVEACDLALHISRRHGFTSMAYDFMRGPGEWVIGEISYTFALNPIYSQTLFRRAGGCYHKTGPIPICEMHLQAMQEQPESAVSPLLSIARSRVRTKEESELDATESEGSKVSSALR